MKRSKVSINTSSSTLPISFISRKDRKYLKFAKGAKSIYEPSKYEIYTYFAISKAINRGKIYCNESIKYKNLKSDLISNEIWENKDELLKTLGYPNIEVTARARLKKIGELLHDKILKVNQRIANNENEYFKKDGDDWFLKYPTTAEEINHEFFKRYKKRVL